MTPMRYEEGPERTVAAPEERRSLRLSRRQMVVVVASMLVTATVAVVFALLSPPVYETTRSIIVYSGANPNENDTISGAIENIVKSKGMAAEVKRRGGFEESIDEVNSLIGTSRSPLSPYIDITVSSPDKEQSEAGQRPGDPGARGGVRVEPAPTPGRSTDCRTDLPAGLRVPPAVHVEVPGLVRSPVRPASRWPGALPVLPLPQPPQAGCHHSPGRHAGHRPAGAGEGASDLGADRQPARFGVGRHLGGGATEPGRAHPPVGAGRAGFRLGPGAHVSGVGQRDRSELRPAGGPGRRRSAVGVVDRTGRCRGYGWAERVPLGSVVGRQRSRRHPRRPDAAEAGRDGCPGRDGQVRAVRVSTAAATSSGCGPRSIEYWTGSPAGTW